MFPRSTHTSLGCLGERGLLRELGSAAPVKLPPIVRSVGEQQKIDRGLAELGLSMGIVAEDASREAVLEGLERLALQAASTGAR